MTWLKSYSSLKRLKLKSKIVRLKPDFIPSSRDLFDSSCCLLKTQTTCISKDLLWLLENCNPINQLTWLKAWSYIYLENFLSGDSKWLVLYNTQGLNLCKWLDKTWILTDALSLKSQYPVTQLYTSIACGGFTHFHSEMSHFVDDSLALMAHTSHVPLCIQHKVQLMEQKNFSSQFSAYFRKMVTEDCHVHFCKMVMYIFIIPV